MIFLKEKKHDFTNQIILFDIKFEAFDTYFFKNNIGLLVSSKYLFYVLLSILFYGLNE